MAQKLAFKLCIFGAGGVGKTTMIRRFVTKIFEEDLKMTIGADFSIKNVTVEGKKITLRIWDFAGEERFRVLLPSFAKGADGGIFMFDITRYSSVKEIEDWLSIFEYFVAESQIEIPIIMVGGKSDLEDNRSVQIEEAIELVNKYKLHGYLECSSKTGENVEEIFESIAKKMIENK
ncbi:MAG: GTP-binding protein [Candidatus Lokiarchaeota archaeon]|nr:GTP-binding protein [Candidatus Lokiarchaeota archaeon]